MLNKKMSKKISDHNIFIQEKDASKSQDRSNFSQSYHGIPYLKRGDSAVYIDQFMSGKDQPPSPLKLEPLPINSVPPLVQEDPKEQSAMDPSNRSDAQEEQQDVPVNPSAFHNFQKHLTVALKHSVSFKDDDKTAKDYVKAGIKLWKTFSQSKICTKKVLHFLLGDRNQHQITHQDVRQFGFTRIYQTFGDKVITEARIFLLKEVLRQVKQEKCLELYFQHKRIKDKQKFKRYVGMFVEELEAGFLKKRLPREKVAELMKP